MEVDKKIALRFSEIRKKNGITQAEFAKTLEIGRSTVANLENGTTSLTDRNIKMACFAYNVNETWLRTGIGEMFNKSLHISPNTSDEEKLLNMFRLLVPEMQAIVIKKVKELLDSIEKPWIQPPVDKEKGEEKGA